MMIAATRNTIQDKLLALYTAWLTKKATRSFINRQHSFSTIIGLVYTHDPANLAKTITLVQVVKKLQARNQQLQVLCYLPDHTIAEKNMPFDTITKKEINLLGQSKNKPFKTFLKLKFAYLYHLDLGSDVVLDYIVAKCIAHRKIGNYMPGREALFDVMFKDLLQPTAHLAFESLIDKMFSYTQLLKI